MLESAANPNHFTMSTALMTSLLAAIGMVFAFWYQRRRHRARDIDAIREMT
jgi:hypothetical protein